MAEWWPNALPESAHIPVNAPEDVAFAALDVQPHDIEAREANHPKKGGEGNAGDRHA